MIEINSIQFKALVAEAVTEAIQPHLRKLSAPMTKPLYTSPEVLELLGISKRSLQYLRDVKAIGFVQHGRKIHYRAEDVNEFIDKHHVARRKVA